MEALRDLTTPGSGLHEAIVDLVLWRARKHTQGQQVWVPPIEWGQALTHDTGINVTCQGTVRLQRAPAETDHPADPNRPEQWEQATAPARDTALRAASLRTPDDDLPPPNYRQWTPPAGGLGYSPRARALLRDSRYSYFPWPAMAHQRNRHHVRPRDRPARGSRGPHYPAQGPQGRPPARKQALSPRPGPNHLREGGLPPGIGHALPDPLDPAPLATHGDRALGRGGPGHTTKPPIQTAAIPHLRVPRPPQGPQPRGS